MSGRNANCFTSATREWILLWDFNGFFGQKQTNSYYLFKKATLRKDGRTELEKAIMGVNLPFHCKSHPPLCFCHSQMLNALIFLGFSFPREGHSVTRGRRYLTAAV